jgi:hypothetical protein
MTANAAVACSSFLMLPPVAETTRRKLIARSAVAAVAAGTHPPSQRGCHSWFGGGPARFARNLVAAEVGYFRLRLRSVFACAHAAPADLPGRPRMARSVPASVEKPHNTGFSRGRSRWLSGLILARTAGSGGNSGGNFFVGRDLIPERVWNRYVRA